MMKEAYVSFETAELLKEKGFDESIHTWYNMDDDTPTFIEGYIKISNVDFVANDEDCFSAPTHQMACAWLREVHKIFILVGWSATQKEYFTRIINMTDGCPKRNVHNHTNYEEAMENALKYTLENLI